MIIQCFINEKIEYYNIYSLILKYTRQNKGKMTSTLVSDIKLYHSLPKECRHLVLETKRKQYGELLSLFEEFHNEEGVLHLIDGIKDDLQNGKSKSDIVKYCGEKIKPFVIYVLDNLNFEQSINKQMDNIDS